MVESRLVVDPGEMTGSRIKQLARIPGDFALYRRAPGGNQPIRDEEMVDVRNGDHYFARPSRDGKAHR